MDNETARMGDAVTWELTLCSAMDEIFFLIPIKKNSFPKAQVSDDTTVGQNRIVERRIIGSICNFCSQVALFCWRQQQRTRETSPEIWRRVSRVQRIQSNIGNRHQYDAAGVRCYSSAHPCTIYMHACSINLLPSPRHICAPTRDPPTIPSASWAPKWEFSCPILQFHPYQPRGVLN